MPHRRYSGLILGGLWPLTSPDDWSDVADGLLRKAESLEDNAATIRQRAEGLVGENSGKTIDAMYQVCQRQAAAVSRWAETYRSMARGISGTARVIYSARSTLDRIDANANEEIERIRQEAAAHARIGGSALIYAEAQQRIAAVIAEAKAEATAESSKAAAKIASVASTIGGGQKAPPSASNGAPPALDPELQKYFGPGGGPGPGLHGFLQNLPQGGGPDGNSGSSQNGPTPGSRFGAQDPQPSNPSGETPPAAGTDAGSGTEPGTDPGKGDGLHDGDPRHPAPNARFGGFDGPNGQSGSQLPPPVTPFGPSMGSPLSSGSGPGGGVPFSPARGLSSPSLPMSSGLAGSSAPPLGGPGLSGAAAPSLPSTAGGVPPAASGADFTRGFNAGFVGGSALPPPVAAPPPSGSATPAVAPSAGPPPVASSAPPAAASGPAAASAAPMAAPMMPPPPAGPLPPFGSDVTPRQVAPASGPAPAAPPPAPPAPASSAAAVAPLPPGVAGSGVGAAAAGAYAGVKSSSDPLLEMTSKLVYQLVHASLVYGCVDWCVGIFKTPHGIDTVVVSNEGAPAAAVAAAGTGRPPFRMICLLCWERIWEQNIARTIRTSATR